MGLVEDIDEDIQDEPDETYVLAMGLAGTAERYVNDAEWADVARSIRDVFGTYVHRIHSYGGRGGSLEASLAAHRDIAAARDDWTSTGRSDPAAFAARWLAAVGPIDTTWLDEPSTPNLLRGPGPA